MINPAHLPFIRNTIIFTLAMLCVTVKYSHATIIQFNSGRIVEGEILKRDDDLIIVDSGIGIPITYYFDEIRSIDGEMIRPVKEEVVEPEKKPIAPEPVTEEVEPVVELKPVEEAELMNKINAVLGG